MSDHIYLHLLYVIIEWGNAYGTCCTFHAKGTYGHLKTVLIFVETLSKPTVSLLLLTAKLDKMQMHRMLSVSQLLLKS